MTTADERTRAILQARQFLEDLQRTSRTPGVPKEVRDEALRLLRHYPDAGDLAIAAAACPQWYGKPDAR